MPSKSKKQARLMAAVAHNPKFAKKVGIPQSVGREFNEADRGRRFADGGKVSQALRFLKLGLKKREVPVLSNPATAEDAGRMKMLMKELYPEDDWLRTWESDNNSVAFPASAGIHEQLIEQLKKEFPNENFTIGLGITLKELEEQLLKKGRFTGYDSIYDPYADVRDFGTDTHPGFADGGEVLPSSRDEEEPWSDTYIKRPLSGLASMWGSADPETGEFVNPVWHNLKRAWGADERRRQGQPAQRRLNPGIVDETMSLPALGGIIGLPVPQFAQEAEERAGVTREAARESLGLDAPHGFAENIAESAGVMAGQLPVPASVANRLKLLKQSGKLGKVGKVLGPAAEWFSPTVVPQAGNYIKGTLFGGVLGGGLDYLGDYLDSEEAKERHKQFISEAMAEVLAEESGDEDSDEEALTELGYAEGGRVKQAKQVIGNLRQVLSKVDPEDVELRKTAIDNVLLSLKGTAGVPEIDRQQLHTMTTGLSDAAADVVPERRKQRFGDYENNVLRLLEQRVAPVLIDQPTSGPLPPAPSTPMPERFPIRSDDPHVRLDRDLGPMRPDQVYDPAGGADNRFGVLTPEEWNRMLNLKKQFATGGEVGVNKRNHMIPSPQSQKDPAFQASRTAAPLSQEWYETYGQGPEHQFFGERRLPELKDWSPVKQATPTPAPTSGGGSSTLSNLVNLAGLGLLGYDVYQDYFKNPTTPTGSISYPADTASTNEWIERDLADMEMPTAEFDPTVWERTQQGAGGAFDIYMGSQQGGAEGAGNMLSGAGNLYEALGGENQFSGAAGEVGGILQGVGEGTIGGYLQAGGDAVALAKRLGYTGPVFDQAGKLLPVVGDLFSAYEGIKSGNPAGYAQAAGSLYGAASATGLAPATGALASSGLGTAMPLAALGFAAAGVANQALGVGKKGAVLDAYLESLGGRRANVKEARNKPGGYKAGYYVLPDGRVVSNQELKDMYVGAGSPFGDYV